MTGKPILLLHAFLNLNIVNITNRDNMSGDKTEFSRLARFAITKLEECPHEFKCPITLEMMESPYLLFQSGRSYEYEALLKALATKPGKDPLTNKPFQGSPQFVENHNLRKLIQDWKNKIKTMQSFQSQTTTNQNPDNRYDCVPSMKLKLIGENYDGDRMWSVEYTPR